MHEIVGPINLNPSKATFSVECSCGETVAGVIPPEGLGTSTAVQAWQRHVNLATAGT